MTIENGERKIENFPFSIIYSPFKKWCSGGDSNPHGLLHTPLKRARLPITPPEQFDLSKSYFFAGALAGAFAGALAGGLSAGVFAAGAAAFAFVSAETDVFAFASVGAVAFASAGAAVFAFASAVLAFVFELDASTGASGLLDRTETLPVNAGIARTKADIMNVAAAMIVIFDKTVAVPRGANAELETLLGKRAPASVLPGCSRTDATSTMQEMKNSA